MQTLEGMEGGGCWNLRSAPTLNQKVDDDGVKAERVGGRAGVVAWILSFDRAQHQSPVGQNESLPV